MAHQHKLRPREVNCAAAKPDEHLSTRKPKTVHPTMIRRRCHAPEPADLLFSPGELLARTLRWEWGMSIFWLPMRDTASTGCRQRLATAERLTRATVREGRHRRDLRPLPPRPT